MDCLGANGAFTPSFNDAQNKINKGVDRVPWSRFIFFFLDFSLHKQENESIDFDILFCLICKADLKPY